MGFGKVVGGQFVNASISTDRKGEIALSTGGFKKLPRLTPETVASWEEIFPEKRSAADAMSKIGQAVSLAALRGPAGKAAAAAVGTTFDYKKGGNHTVRLDWADGHQSLLDLPDDLFQHFAVVLRSCRIESEAGAVQAPSDPAPSGPTSQVTGVIGHLTSLAGVVRGPGPDTVDQIAKLAALRDQGALTEEEFATKKAELLGTQPPAAVPAAPAPLPEPARAALPEPEQEAALETAPSPAAQPPAPPPAWAPDPMGRHEHRYWDGNSWTHHVSNGGVQETDPL